MLHSNTSKKLSFFFLFCSIILSVEAAYIFIPMDESQSNHLKAYGIVYWVLQNDIEVEWLLNYRGGSFLIDKYSTILVTISFNSSTIFSRSKPVNLCNLSSKIAFA